MSSISSDITSLLAIGAPDARGNEPGSAPGFDQQLAEAAQETAPSTPSTSERQEASADSEQAAAADDPLPANDPSTTDEESTPEQGQEPSSGSTSAPTESDQQTEDTAESGELVTVASIVVEEVAQEPTEQISLEEPVTIEVSSQADSEADGESAQPQTLQAALSGEHGTDGEQAELPSSPSESTSESLQAGVQEATAGEASAESEPTAVSTPPSQERKQHDPENKPVVEEGPQQSQTVSANSKTSTGSGEHAEAEQPRPAASESGSQISEATDELFELPEHDTTESISKGAERNAGRESPPTAESSSPAAQTSLPERSDANAQLTRLAAGRLPASQADSSGGVDQAPRVDAARFVGRVSRAVQSAQQRGGEVRLRLSPPELGALQIKLTLSDGTLTAALETETAAAKNLLLDNLPALRERLAEQEIRVEKFDVDVRDEGRGGDAGDWRPDDREQENQRQPPSSSSTEPSAESAAAEAASASPTGVAAADGAINLVV